MELQPDNNLGDILKRSQKEQEKLREDLNLEEKRLQEEQKNLENNRLEENRREESKRQLERWQAAERRREAKRAEEKRQEALKVEEDKKEKGVTFEKDGREFRLEEPGRVVGQDGMEAYVRNARNTKTGELERNPDGRPKEYLVDEKEKRVWEVDGKRSHQRDDFIAKNPKKQRWQDNEGRTYEVTGERLINARFNRPEWDKDPIKQTISKEVDKGAER